jgi:LAO/AO transport system kinase
MDERALARLISGLEDGAEGASAALRALRAEAAAAGSPPAQVIGVTGPPGSGKSTLVDKLIVAYRTRGFRVGVLAVDPSSPFSGGAILGDRIRMQSRSGDEGVFIRSLASRGRLGGLSSATAQSARALEAAGYGIILIETVGIGQSEVDIARLADTVILVSMPGSGDDIQTIKAGVMEIGDIFVVNKADRDGAERMVREIRDMLETAYALRSGGALPKAPDTLIGHHAAGQGDSHRRTADQGDSHPGKSDCHRGADGLGDRHLTADCGLPPVLKTIAETGEGVEELAGRLDERWAGLVSSGALEARRAKGAMAETRALLALRVVEELEALELRNPGLEEGLASRIARGEIEATEAARLLFDSIRGDKGKGAKA